MVNLRIGTADGTDAHLVAERFNRHTFWCGQSGSGKTYALGVVLEQLLIHTRLPILVMDPNADFVGIGQTVEDADEADAALLRGQQTRVLHSSRADGPAAAGPVRRPRSADESRRAAPRPRHEPRGVQRAAELRA
jgi:hypothetical protein